MLPGFEPNPKATLVGVYIQDCFEEPCYFRRSENVSMEMDIEFHDNVSAMKAKLFALIGGAEIPWDGVNENACEFIVSEGECPFKANDYITYGVDLFVDPVAPPVVVDVRYTIRDENDDDLNCWIVTAQVTNR